MNQRVVRLCTGAAVTAALLLSAQPARAQYRPGPVTEEPSAEQFHIQGGIGLFNPNADLTLESEGLGLLGSDINYKDDLGLQDKGVPAFSLVGQPARHHKLRFEYIPLSYDGTNKIARRLVFNGQAYPANADVTWAFDWKAYRFGYEFDFFNRDRGFAGFLLDVKYVDIGTQLTAPVGSRTIDEFATQRAPIPTIGGIGRVYIAPAISATVEITGIKLPNVSDRYQAHYLDAAVYGTVNVNRYVGAQVGWRSLDLGYVLKNDTGSLTVSGLYFGLVARY